MQKPVQVKLGDDLTAWLAYQPSKGGAARQVELKVGKIKCEFRVPAPGAITIGHQATAEVVFADRAGTPAEETTMANDFRKTRRKPTFENVNAQNVRAVSGETANLRFKITVTRG